ncbi:hypothetical protein BDM02DRAFT_3116793 [Thelephora ganbajun]|uniref:Uncharacterized protein n=1 Tax=Thelephora ganbajun TaxID=370292 RepID=A0ACB6ZEJ1_THEGA|nr:hypothetical protein BDM02DRAFT_3116793 [Thelephora ganbajun]
MLDSQRLIAGIGLGLPTWNQITEVKQEHTRFPDLFLLGLECYHQRSSFGDFERAHPFILNANKRHFRQSTEPNGGSKNDTVDDGSMVLLSVTPIIIVTGWCIICLSQLPSEWSRREWTSQITHLYMDLRDLAERNRSYCVYLHSSPLEA